MSTATTRLRDVTLPTPGLTHPRFSRLRFMTDGADAGTPGAGDGGNDPGDKGDEQGDPADEPLREPGKKALAAERERAAKAEKEAADLRKQIEDSTKSAEEKATDDLKAAQAAASENAAKALRYEVAAEKGISLTLATRLTGATKEELLADADVLMKDFPEKAAPSDDGKPHVPYRDLSRNKGEAPTPSRGAGTLRAAYADQN